MQTQDSKLKAVSSSNAVLEENTKQTQVLRSLLCSAPAVEDSL